VSCLPYYVFSVKVKLPVPLLCVCALPGKVALEITWAILCRADVKPYSLMLGNRWGRIQICCTALDIVSSSQNRIIMAYNTSDVAGQWLSWSFIIEPRRTGSLSIIRQTTNSTGFLRRLISMMLALVNVLYIMLAYH